MKASNYKNLKKRKRNTAKFGCKIDFLYKSAKIKLISNYVVFVYFHFNFFLMCKHITLEIVTSIPDRSSTITQP